LISDFSTDFQHYSIRNLSTLHFIWLQYKQGRTLLTRKNANNKEERYKDKEERYSEVLDTRYSAFRLWDTRYSAIRYPKTIRYPFAIVDGLESYTRYSATRYPLLNRYPLPSSYSRWPRLFCRVPRLSTMASTIRLLLRLLSIPRLSDRRYLAKGISQYSHILFLPVIYPYPTFPYNWKFIGENNNFKL